MTTPDIDSMAELIADCTEIPAVLRTGGPAVQRTGSTVLPVPRTAAPWSVTDACVAQVREFDEYV